ncbi:MAG: transketolase family protein, partial [Oscillospiraceae bacterium]|nr:transketolase family protein [Oscillospiraceae bacterium]
MEKLDMRTLVGQTVAELMEQEPDILVLDADLSAAVGTTPLYSKF